MRTARQKARIYRSLLPFAFCLLPGRSEAVEPAGLAQQRFRAGLAYERLGRLDEAYTELQLAANLDPDSSRIALAVGLVAGRLRRYEEAQRQLEHAIALEADSCASYYQLALLYEKKGMNDRAIESWQRFYNVSQDAVLKAQAQKHMRVLEGPPATVNPAADLSTIHRVAVLPLEGAGSAEATHAVIQRLLNAGLKVSAPDSVASATLSGAVTEYRPANRLTVFLASGTWVSSAGKTTSLAHPIVSQAESPLVAADGAVFSMSRPQIICTNASVGISARLTDPASGAVLWSDEFAYEGIDAESALQSVTGALAASLQRAGVGARPAAPARPFSP